jgi:hypothetical protein
VKITTAKLIRYLASQRAAVAADPSKLPAVTWATSLGTGGTFDPKRLLGRADRFLSLPRHKQRRAKALAISHEIHWRMTRPAMSNLHDAIVEVGRKAAAVVTKIAAEFRVPPSVMGRP